MNYKKSILIFLALFISCVFSFSALGIGNNETSRSSLKRIKSISVYIDDTQEAIDKGLSVYSIQTDTELKLRQMGIKVADSEAEKLNSDAVLYIQIQTYKPAKLDIYAFNIYIEIVQIAKISKTKTLIPAGTWSNDLTGFAGGDIMPDYIRKGTNDLVDTFLNAYLSVNPK